MRKVAGVLLIFLLVFVFWALAACDDDDDDDDQDDDQSDDDITDDDLDDDTVDDDADDDVTDDDTDQWEPVAPHREQRGIWTIVWLAGSAYEMGYQQGDLLHDELAAGIDWLDQYHLIDILLPIARLLGLVDIAYENSYQDIIDECQGLSDAAGDVGWSMDVCMLLNFGDVLVEFLSDGFPPAIVNLLRPG
ncbi:MAG: hypothetical protein ACTSXZ_02385, partial [Alphaproteobacteria bacterium]